VSQFNSKAVAFLGSAVDGRYVYFIPDTLSTIMRLDSEWPPGVCIRCASY
jgi:hypothetical protein